jgi:hypothetical protein
VDVLVTGGSGLQGSHLTPALARAGHRVFRAVRRAPVAADEVRWTPSTGALEPFRAFDAVIHLAGRSLATSRWTPAFKREAWRSRVDATRALCERLVAGSAPPRVFACASAIGFYGDRGEEWLDESSAPGEGFPADLARAWEAACEPMARAGRRVVNLRFGMILAKEGGALAPLLLTGRLGLNGPMGSGRQFWSWVSIEDVVAVFLRVLERAELSGPVNVVSPRPVRQREFARVLGRVLGRPAFWPAPAMLLRPVLGEKLDALLLASARVAPRRLERDGYPFHHPELEDALRALLGRG